jgi:hypothetical protein
MSQPRQLRHAVNQVAAQAIGKDWPLYARLIEHWREIVGDELAESTSPSKIMIAEHHAGNRNRHQHGTLHIRLPRGLAMEMQYRVHQITERVNHFFGYEAISRIVLEHDTRQPKPIKTKQIAGDLSDQDHVKIDAMVAGITDPELRAATQSLAEAVAKRTAGRSGEQG